MKGRNSVLQVLIVVVSLLLPHLLASHVGLGRATGLLSLASLATLVISARLGWRQALLGGLALSLLCIPAVWIQGYPAAAALLLMAAAMGLGVSARWQIKPIFWLLMVVLCMAVVDVGLPATLSNSELGHLIALMLGCCSFSALSQGVLLPSRASEPTRLAVQHSWRRSVAYGALLALTAAITTPIALSMPMHVSRLWLILTPFLVLQPFVREAWRVALHRSLGTVTGVLLVMLLALGWPAHWPTLVPALVLGAVTALVAIKHGHPAVLLMALTATIVLFNSNPADLVLMADDRLQSTGIGLAISLGVMALAQPFEQRLMRTTQNQSDADCILQSTSKQ